MEIYTIGHSSHSQELFARMLIENNIELLADVRAFPGSRKWPQFSKDEFPKWLSQEGILYEHFSKLGGRRKKSKEISEEINAGWRNQSFHNYADYTLSEDFQLGINRLLEMAKDKTTAYCCSERHPSRCHRLLISNWLVANGHIVKHIIDGKDGEIELVYHEVGIWGAPAQVNESGVVTYPSL
ncbi:Protein of unknown function, DUF488 [Psychrobacillus sp. OK028]|uniref:DUF488 domain-containing protein n=1 Tax=Psychrobacillus sp. OK028 TaxID=1884359 RepID=UPI000884FDDE|nr:DUF488 domain-containing protein [Psychrobacillus sp. OK028]SDO20979.1 Protein of unknown function, DUF488 [Psychrobacillus sp. OK028]